ncbi:MAG: IS1595 family transposase [Dehalococcoidia bacterium]|nr:IS1595 family transposase [Dehalococcoidia bacterium]
MAEKRFPTSLLEAVRYFEDPDVCRDFVVSLRWPNGVTCPREGCGSDRVAFVESRKIWRCNGCRKQFSVKVGTIFEDSPIGLEKWLPAIWMLTSAKQGVSSYQLSRALGITQKSAWHMEHRIRVAMRTESFNKPLDGEVEADESFFGGKAKNMHYYKKLERTKGGRGAAGKAIVMGVLQRGGDVRANTIPDTRRRTLQSEVRKHVAPGSAVYTDALPSYRGLSDDYLHEFVDHTYEYVNGRVSTNSLEGFWSLVKRSVDGTYHSVEPVHLDRYLDEFTRRFNTRKLSDAQRFVLTVSSAIGRRLTYKELIGQASTAP